MKRVLYAFIVLMLLCAATAAFGQKVSDEARRYFDRAMAAVEMAKTPADYEKAVVEFEKAKSLAPDWPDVYYNLGLIQDKAGMYSEAMENLRKYLLLAPDAKDAEAVRTLINKLEYKEELIAPFKKFEGEWISENDGGVYRLKALPENKVTMIQKTGEEPGAVVAFHGVIEDSGRLKGIVKVQIFCPAPDREYPMTGLASSDGQTIQITWMNENYHGGVGGCYPLGKFTEITDTYHRRTSATEELIGSRYEEYTNPRDGKVYIRFIQRKIGKDKKVIILNDRQ